MDVGPPDARELAAFTELENKLVDASRRVKSVRKEGRGEKKGEREKKRNTMPNRSHHWEV